MSLPFENEKSVRKHTCFVCGIQLKDLDSYKSHIIEEHEEGREYILCPLPHCQFPVRDVRMHMAHRHPNFPVPKTGMMRALIWKDPAAKNNKEGKLKTKKPKFREGYYKSTKMNRELHYRSGWESTIYECLDSDIEVTSFDVEPFEIPYIHKGKAHKYIPDIIVKFLDGHTEVWEIKPSAQTLLEKNQDKWRAANSACQARGWIFEVKTEKGIDKLKNKIRLQRGLAKEIFSESSDDEPLAEDIKESDIDF